MQELFELQLANVNHREAANIRKQLEDKLAAGYTITNATPVQAIFGQHTITEKIIYVLNKPEAAGNPAGITP